MRILLASSIFPDTIKKLRERYDIVDAINANEEKLKLLIKNCEAIIFQLVHSGQYLILGRTEDNHINFVFYM